MHSTGLPGCVPGCWLFLNGVTGWLSCAQRFFWLVSLCDPKAERTMAETRRLQKQLSLGGDNLAKGGGEPGTPSAGDTSAGDTSAGGTSAGGTSAGGRPSATKTVQWDDEQLRHGGSATAESSRSVSLQNEELLAEVRD